MSLTAEAAADRLAKAILSSASRGGQRLRAAVVAANPMAGESAGTVGLYLDGDTSVIVPAVGGPGLAPGQVVTVFVGTTLVCVQVAGSARRGRATVSVSAGTGSASVSFPSGVYAAAPVVVVTPEGGTGQTWFAQVTAVSASGFTVALTQSGGSAFTGSRSVAWIALAG